MYEGPYFSHSLIIVHQFYYSHSSGCEMTSNCGLDVHFLMTNDVGLLSLYLLAICIIFFIQMYVYSNFMPTFVELFS